METIFWAYFNTDNSRHDRREYFKQEMSLDDFNKWLNIHRKSIEEKQGTIALVENMGFIEKKILLV